MEGRLFADGADGRWDEHSLLAAALVASGVADPDVLTHYEIRVAQWAAELERSPEVSGPPRRRAQAVFEFMHRRILQNGYDLNATDLRLALDEGRYNCVSASVLFGCLAGRFGLRVRGLQTPGHAMCRLILPDGTLDVETTCPGWFRLTNDPERAWGRIGGSTAAGRGQSPTSARLGSPDPAASGPRSGAPSPARAEVEAALPGRPSWPAATAPPQAALREVSDVELVAAIYYNRGVDLLGEKRFAEAAAANAKALRLDPSATTARTNLLATINNWAIDRGGAACYREAVDLLRQGITLDPSYPTFRVNCAYVYSKWMEALCRLGRFQEALDLTVEAIEDGADEECLCRARLDVYRRLARTHFEAGQFDRANAVFDQAKRPCSNPAEGIEAEAAEVNRHAFALFREGRLEESARVFTQARARQPSVTNRAGKRCRTPNGARFDGR